MSEKRNFAKSDEKEIRKTRKNESLTCGMWEGERPQEDYGATGNNNCLLVFQPQETQSLDDDIRNLSNSNSWKRLILTNSDFLHFY